MRLEVKVEYPHHLREVPCLHLSLKLVHVLVLLELVLLADPEPLLDDAKMLVHYSRGGVAKTGRLIPIEVAHYSIVLIFPSVQSQRVQIIFALELNLSFYHHIGSGVYHPLLEELGVFWVEF